MIENGYYRYRLNQIFENETLHPILNKLLDKLSTERFTSTLLSIGVSHFGIGELEALATDTHKFEAHYLDSLIGPYPASKNLYYQRSPINFLSQLRCPVAFFQGLDDKVKQ